MDKENLMEQLHLRYATLGINSDTQNMELGVLRCAVHCCVQSV